MIHSVLLMILIVCDQEWGFFGHRLINRVAVYTVPTEMSGWYKPYIDYISDHAVDPDKRRYATKHEAVRHYIDLDQWGAMPFDHVPRSWDKALALNLEVFHVAGDDTVYVFKAIPHEYWKDSIQHLGVRLDLVRSYYIPQYYEDEAVIPCDSFAVMTSTPCDAGSVLHLTDVFSEHGIVPYHLVSMQRRLTNAFRDNDLQQVLRLSAELGHYIGDACVPLHTTSNYNGQLTNQVGIHAFWESRIPELFAINEFDMVVGGAEYIEDPGDYFWRLVLSSHSQVESVLAIEKHLSETFPTDKQFCFEDRLSQNVRTQCPEFALAYHQAMNNMVEDRFRVAVKALGDAWYTAWIDAGQPLPPSTQFKPKDDLADEELNKAVRNGKSYGREHDN